jgi:iron-regulated transporter 1
MLAYLKSQRGFSDPFIAGMRGAAVVAGLAGTLVMPVLERRVGLVRGGAWSVWCATRRNASLPTNAPVGRRRCVSRRRSSRCTSACPRTRRPGPARRGTRACSSPRSRSRGSVSDTRYMPPDAAPADAQPGLWSFDLIQLQTLQEALRAHPRRSRLAGLQLSLQAAFDLAKYALVLALNR